MIRRLDHLILPDPLPDQIFEIPAEHWNELVKEIERRRERPGISQKRTGKFDHPFRVVASRWDAGDPDRDWRLDITPGTVNDQLAAIPYLKDRDPRGWEIPEDHPEKGSTKRTVDRSLLEVDPPFLIVSAPEAGKSESDDFIAAPSRPLFFQTAERIERPLLRAHVMVSAEPRHITKGLEVANFKRFRIFAGRKPTTSASVPGGIAEIARLWLLRGDTPAADEIFVQQMEFWCLGSVDNQPQSVIPDDFSTGVGFSDAFLALIRQQEAQLLDDAGSIEFWTQ